MVTEALTAGSAACTWAHEQAAALGAGARPGLAWHAHPRAAAAAARHLSPTQLSPAKLLLIQRTSLLLKAPVSPMCASSRMYRSLSCSAIASSFSVVATTSAGFHGTGHGWYGGQVRMQASAGRAAQQAGGGQSGACFKCAGVAAAGRGANAP